jgi:predicted nucleic acid-binding protein
MKKIILDLNVVTNALWKGRGEEAGKRFIERIKKGEFEIYTPYTLLRLLLRWKNIKKVLQISDFYFIYSDEIITLRAIRKKIEEIKLNYKKLLKELVYAGIKREDGFLVIIASIFGLWIVAFNKKHLYNKKDEINRVLKNFNLREIEIYVTS